MAAYYNEFDPFAAAWLRELIKEGLIADGHVDTRSIEDVTPSDLNGFTQCHFFAGIGVWSHSLRLAGWPDSRPVWTGSCPCQPFSAAGKGGGFADERHLWPAFHHLIRIHRPVVVFGEQVASKDGLAWIDLVQADLEGEGYACGAVDSCAAGFGAPHIRQRLYWVADANDMQSEQFARERARPGEEDGRRALGEHARHGDTYRLDHAISDGRGACGNDHAKHDGKFFGADGDACRLADNDRDGRQSGSEGSEAMGHGQTTGPDCGVVGLADAYRRGRGQDRLVGGLPEIHRGGAGERVQIEGAGVRSDTGPTNGHWRDADWLLCRDGKWRPVAPGTFPLAHGTPNRVGQLRGAGNAIVAWQAQAFIEAYLGVMP